MIIEQTNLLTDSNSKMGLNDFQAGTLLLMQGLYIP